MENQKKIPAAVAAVMQYLMAEEELALKKAERVAPAAIAGPGPWALNGRQTQMQLRTLMQLRTFGRRS